MTGVSISPEHAQHKLLHISPIRVDEVQEDDKIIVLLGPTGVGKSNFIERLTHEKLEISSFSLQRGTNELTLYRVTDHPTWKRRIVLVDTPGFQDATISEYGSLKAIREWIKSSKPPRLHALCYMDSIKQAFRGGDKHCWDLFMSICGEASAHRTCLVTTRWDEVGKRDGISDKSAIASQSAAERKRGQLKQRWDPYLGKGLHFFEFNNTSSSADHILTTILGTEDYRAYFHLENMKISLKNPPVQEYILQLLGDKFHTIRHSISTMKEDLSELFDDERLAKEQEKLQSLLKDYGRLRAEMLEFHWGRLVLAKLFILELPSWVYSTVTAKAKRLTLHKRRPPSGDLDVEPAQSSGEVLSKPPTAVYIDISNLDTPNTLLNVPLNDIKQDDIIVLVMGASGVGKGTFLSAIAERNVDEGGSAKKAVDTAIHCIRIPIRATQSNLVLVDTPGFDTAERSNANILEDIAEWLKSSYEQGKRLNGIVYLHRITDIRFDSSAATTLTLFRRLCGGRNFKQVCFTTTKWSHIHSKEKVEHEGKEEELKNLHWKSFLDKGSVTSRLDTSTDETARETAMSTLRSLVARDHEKIVLQIQREMVDQRKKVHHTNAGKHAFALEEKLIDELHHLVSMRG